MSVLLLRAKEIVFIGSNIWIICFLISYLCIFSKSWNSYYPEFAII